MGRNIQTSRYFDDHERPLEHTESKLRVRYYHRLIRDVVDLYEKVQARNQLRLKVVKLIIDLNKFRGVL